MHTPPHIMPMHITAALLLTMALLLSGPGCAAHRDAQRELDALPNPGEGASARYTAPRDTSTGVTTASAGRSLDDYVARAIAQHPALAAEHAAWRAQLAMTRASYLPLPPVQLTYEVYLRELDRSLDGRRHSVAIMQPLPTRAQREAPLRAATSRLRAAPMRFDALMLAIREQVATLYWTCWELDQLAEVQREQLAILDALIQLASARYEANAAPISDLQLAQLDHSDATERLAALLSQRRAQSAALMQAIGALPTDADIAITPVTPPDPLRSELPDLAALTTQAMSHPQLLAIDRLTRATRDEAHLATLKNSARVAVGLQVGSAMMAGMTSPEPSAHGGGGDARAPLPLIAMVSVALPTWRDAAHAEADAAQARGIAQRAELLRAQQERAQQVFTQHNALIDARRRAHHYTYTVLPQVNSLVDASLATYEVGRSDLPAVLRATRRALDARSATIKARADWARATAKLHALTASPLPSDAEPAAP